MATAIKSSALQVSFVYTDGRLHPTRIVTTGPAHAHEILMKGSAQIADEASANVYSDWCDAHDVEPVDTDDWDLDLAIYQSIGDEQTDIEDEIEEAEEAEGVTTANTANTTVEEMDAIDLGAVAVKDLPDALAKIDDLAHIREWAEFDERTSAARHYDARIEELEGATEPDDG